MLAGCQANGGGSACIQKVVNYINQSNNINNAALAACKTAACVTYNLNQMSGGTAAMAVLLNNANNLATDWGQALLDDQSSSFTSIQQELGFLSNLDGIPVTSQNISIISANEQALENELPSGYEAEAEHQYAMTAGALALGAGAGVIATTSGAVGGGVSGYGSTGTLTGAAIGAAGGAALGVVGGAASDLLSNTAASIIGNGGGSEVAQSIARATAFTGSTALLGGAGADAGDWLVHGIAGGSQPNYESDFGVGAVLGGLSSAAEAGAMAAKADNLIITGQSAVINTLGSVGYTAASGIGASTQTGGNKPLNGQGDQ